MSDPHTQAPIMSQEAKQRAQDVGQALRPHIEAAKQHGSPNSGFKQPELSPETARNIEKINEQEYTGTYSNVHRALSDSGRIKE